MNKGTIKWFNKQKRYGFIVPDEGDKDIFVHRSEIKVKGGASLNEGQKVEYDIREGKKGQIATNVIPTK
jgi:CspA family cold shock protein